MKTLFIVMFFGSLLTNAWLLQRRVANRDATASNLSPNASAPTSASKPATVATAASEVTKVLAGADVAMLRAWLVGTEADAATVRALLEGVLWRRHDEQASASRIERFRTAWWRGESVAIGTANMVSVRAKVRGSMQAMLGPDPLDLADAELRYDFLPPEKRCLLATIDLDYAEMRGSTSPGGLSNAPTKSEIDQQELLLREKRKDILAALSADEHAEYELRNSRVVQDNVRRFAAMAATEPEFRAIAPVIDSFNRQMKTLRSSEPDYLATRAQLEQRTMDQLVTTLGYDRALDYLWAVGSGPYGPLVRFLQESDLPTSRAAQLLELAAETGVKGAAIHQDASLAADQKRAALAELQVAVRPLLDALVPSGVQPRLPADAMAWFNALGDGRYAPHRTAVSSNVWFAATPISVTTPPQTPIQPVPLPRRGGH